MNITFGMREFNPIITRSKSLQNLHQQTQTKQKNINNNENPPSPNPFDKAFKDELVFHSQSHRENKLKELITQYGKEKTKQLCKEALIYLDDKAPNDPINFSIHNFIKNNIDIPASLMMAWLRDEKKNGMTRDDIFKDVCNTIDRIA